MTRFLLLPLLLLGFAASAQTTPAPDNPRVGLSRPPISSGFTAGLNATPEPIYIIDGQIMDSLELLNIGPDQIKSVRVVKGNEAISLYGDKGKNGIVLIATQLAKTNCE